MCMIKSRTVSVDLYPLQLYLEMLRKYFHSAEASETQPRWTAVMSNDVGAATDASTTA